ncbi:MAG: hypothetical protein HXY30_13800 [Pseudorhodoplanes sp.]|nr:hypothetical protein [Pseudorhodoplanes sp.]
MTRHAGLIALMSALVFCAPSPASAAFVCPVPAVGANAAKDREIAAAIPAGDALDDVAKLNAAVSALRGKGIGNAVIVDSMISAYCPAVARTAGLSDDEKRTRVRRFAARIVRVVYALDGAEAVILDVPFRPSVANTINARAATARISPEAWVAGVVDRYLKSSR